MAFEENSSSRLQSNNSISALSSSNLPTFVQNHSRVRDTLSLHLHLYLPNQIRFHRAELCFYTFKPVHFLLLVDLLCLLLALRIFHRCPALFLGAKWVYEERDEDERWNHTQADLEEHWRNISEENLLRSFGVHLHWGRSGSRVNMALVVLHDALRTT